MRAIKRIEFSALKVLLKCPEAIDMRFNGAALELLVPGDPNKPPIQYEIRRCTKCGWEGTELVGSILDHCMACGNKGLVKE